MRNVAQGKGKGYGIAALVCVGRGSRAGHWEHGYGSVAGRCGESETFKIGVDNAAPKGHDWLFVDFFPRRDVEVHRGDVLDFSWNKGSIDGLHEVAFLPMGGQPLPLVATDFDAGEPCQLQANPPVFGPVFGPSGPGCGTPVNPCDYNGSTRVSSGAQPTVLGAEYFVKIDVPQSDDTVTINYHCEIHPGMQGSISVVPDSKSRSTADQVEDAAEAQFRADTRGALDAEEDVENHAVSRHHEGKRTVTVTAGTATPFVEVVEMLPRKIKIDEGDQVKFTTRTIKDIHTVTFPQARGQTVWIHWPMCVRLRLPIRRLSRRGVAPTQASSKRISTRSRWARR